MSTEAEEYLLLETVTREQLVKTVTDENTSLCSSDV
jgi:hypothetical protein